MFFRNERPGEKEHSPLFSFTKSLKDAGSVGARPHVTGNSEGAASLTDHGINAGAAFDEALDWDSCAEHTTLKGAEIRISFGCSTVALQDITAKALIDTGLRL